MRTRPCSRVVAILLLACSSLPALHAQDTSDAKCSAEVKLLLVPATVQSVVKALKASPPASEQIYLFDTQTLDLFSKGVIVRVRKGANGADLMVKVRVPLDQSLTLEGMNAGYKCEVDRSGDAAVRSYSVLTRIAEPLPQSGNDVLKLLSPAQKRLLEQTHISPDWARVQTIVDVSSTLWRIPREPGLPKLSLEMWQWRSRQLLELSAKTSGDGASAATQLRQTAERKSLAIDATQKQKTALALQSARHGSPP